MLRFVRGVSWERAFVDASHSTRGFSDSAILTLPGVMSLDVTSATCHCQNTFRLAFLAHPLDVCISDRMAMLRFERVVLTLFLAVQANIISLAVMLGCRRFTRHYRGTRF